MVRGVWTAELGRTARSRKVSVTLSFWYSLMGREQPEHNGAANKYYKHTDVKKNTI